MGHLQTFFLLLELCTLFADKGNECIHAHGTEILSVPLTRRNLAGRNFTIADHQHEGCFLHLRLTDLEAQFLIPEISLYPDARGEELIPDLLTIGDLAVRHGHQNGLHGR